VDPAYRAGDRRRSPASSGLEETEAFDAKLELGKNQDIAIDIAAISTG
jgi:hypothetical protein